MPNNFLVMFSFLEFLHSQRLPCSANLVQEYHLVCNSRLLQYVLEGFGYPCPKYSFKPPMVDAHHTQPIPNVRNGFETMTVRSSIFQNSKQNIKKK